MEKLQLVEISLDEFRNMISDVVEEHMKQIDKESPEELLTRREVTERLKISLPTLHKYSELGILTQHKIGERVYYRWSEVLAAAKKIEPRN
jgi:hypothetical protein